jgi:hypothetical protein
MSPKKLMFKTSTYASVPEYGKGLRLGIYQAQAAYGPGASAKNMDRLKKPNWMVKSNITTPLL